MPRVRFQPDDTTVEVELDQTVLEAAQAAGVPHTHVCGGNARCSTCRVRIVDGLEHCHAPTPAEAALCERLNLGDDIRLACQTRLRGEVTVRRLILDDEDVDLLEHTLGGRVGQELRLGILFADIRDSTRLAETIPPYDVIHSLNKYFHRIGHVIERHGGQIESYRGDGLLALFGIEDASNPALSAVKAGLDMLAEVRALEPQLAALFGEKIEIVVGVHVGVVVVGTIGLSGMRQLVAVGDAVNVAARIEDVNKEVGAHLLVSDCAFQDVKDHTELGRTFTRSLKGKTGEYDLYEILDLRSE